MTFQNGLGISPKTTKTRPKNGPKTCFSASGFDVQPELVSWTNPFKPVRPRAHPLEIGSPKRRADRLLAQRENGTFLAWTWKNDGFSTASSSTSVQKRSKNTSKRSISTSRTIFQGPEGSGDLVVSGYYLTQGFSQNRLGPSTFVQKSSKTSKNDQKTTKKRSRFCTMLWNSHFFTVRKRDETLM